MAAGAATSGAAAGAEMIDGGAADTAVDAEIVRGAVAVAFIATAGAIVDVAMSDDAPTVVDAPSDATPGVRGGKFAAVGT
jgi:hypothetical protein